jgi:hypothetical protein
MREHGGVVIKFITIITVIRRKTKLAVGKLIKGLIET